MNSLPAGHPKVLSETDPGPILAGFPKDSLREKLGNERECFRSLHLKDGNQSQVLQLDVR